jgi:hypothetical protein
LIIPYIRKIKPGANAIVPKKPRTKRRKTKEKDIKENYLANPSDSENIRQRKPKPSE